MGGEFAKQSTVYLQGTACVAPHSLPHLGSIWTKIKLLPLSKQDPVTQTGRSKYSASQFPYYVNGGLVKRPELEISVLGLQTDRST